jgi:hypothetical protein
MKLLIDFGRIGKGARHVQPQRFAITLTQTPKPSAQGRDWNSRFLWPLLLGWAKRADE